MPEKERTARKPKADEARGRRFAAIMESRYSWRGLTGTQIEQVIQMADEIHDWMRAARYRRESKP